MNLSREVTDGELFLTFNPPISQARRTTLKRLRWVTQAAAEMETHEAAADKVHDALTVSGQAPFEPAWSNQPGSKPLLSGADWRLLDGEVGGECDEQAGLMTSAMRMLGVPAATQLVFGSTDGDVYSLQRRMVDGQEQYLLLDFGGDGTIERGHWNAFEGVCVTADKVFAIWPKYKANTGLEMLRTLKLQENVKQYWVSLAERIAPGENPPEGWVITRVHEEVLIP